MIQAIDAFHYTQDQLKLLDEALLLAISTSQMPLSPHAKPQQSLLRAPPSPPSVISKSNRSGPDDKAVWILAASVASEMKSRDVDP